MCSKQKATFYINLSFAINCVYTTCIAKHKDLISWKQSQFEVWRNWRLELWKTYELLLLFSVYLCSYLIMCYTSDLAYIDK